MVVNGRGTGKGGEDTLETVRWVLKQAGKAGEKRRKQGTSRKDERKESRLLRLNGSRMYCVVLVRWEKEEGGLRLRQ